MIRGFLVSALLLACGSTAAAQPRYIDGVFAHTGSGPVELLTYADRLNDGRPYVSSGSLEDVPVLDSVYRVLCSLPNWRPTGIWVSTKAIFENDRAERRQLRFGTRPINIYTQELRIADLESAEGVRRLVRDVRATEDNPAYLFITMQASGVTRDYLVQLSAGAKSQ